MRTSKRCNYLNPLNCNAVAPRGSVDFRVIIVEVWTYDYNSRHPLYSVHMVALPYRQEAGARDSAYRFAHGIRIFWALNGL